jgi:hypothetical protein
MMLEVDHEWRWDKNLEGGGRGDLKLLSQYSYQDTGKKPTKTLSHGARYSNRGPIEYECRENSLYSVSDNFTVPFTGNVMK